MTYRVTAICDRGLMNQNRGPRQRLTERDRDSLMEELRFAIAKKLDIDPDRLRYGPLEDAVQGRHGTGGDHWQIFYRGSVARTSVARRRAAAGNLGARAEVVGLTVKIDRLR